MPLGTVTEHKDGQITLTVPFDVGVTNYEFYSSENGAGIAGGMVLRKTVANPGDTGGGLSEMKLPQADLAVRPDRGSFIRIGADGSSKFAEPLTSILISEGGKTMRGKVATGNKLTGLVQKGLFDFQQRDRIRIVRVVAEFENATGYVLKVKDAAGDTTIIDSGAAVLSFSIKEPFVLEVGETLILTTDTNGKAEAAVTRG